MDRKEFWETFRSCLDKLPPRVADVFMLREMEEMDTAQIRDVLRISQNNPDGSARMSGVELVRKKVDN